MQVRVAMPVDPSLPAGLTVQDSGLFNVRADRVPNWHQPLNYASRTAILQQASPHQH